MASAGGVRAGRAFVEIGADPRELQRALRDIQKGISQLGRNLQVAGAAMVAAGSAVLGSIAGASVQFASTGDAIAKMAARTGISVEALSAMSFAAEQSGADLATFEKGIRRMQATINDASMGMASATDSLGALGLSMADLQGLSPDQQFAVIAAALANVADASERAALAQRIFGRAGTALLPLMSAGAGGLAALTAEAQRLGLIMDAETAANAEKLTDAMNSLRRGLGAIVFQVGAAVAPALTTMWQVLSGVAGGVANFIKENQQLVTRVAKVAIVVTTVGGALIGLGTALRLAAFGFGGVSSAANALFQPLRLVATGFASLILWSAKALIGITAYAAASIAAAVATTAAWVVANLPIVALTAAIAALAALLVAAFGGLAALGQAAASALQPMAGWASDAGTSITSTFGTVAQNARAVFGDMYRSASTAFGGISDALAMGDMASAAEIAWLGVKAVWQRGVMAIMSYTDPFIEYLQNAWGNLSTGFSIVTDTTFVVLKNSFRTGFAFIQGVVDNVAGGIMATFDALMTNIQILWTRIQGMITGAEDTQDRISQIESEKAARDEQRRQSMPGITGRLEQAAETNAAETAAVKQRNRDSANENRQNQQDRSQRTQDRAAERQAALDKTQADLDAKRAELAERRAALNESVASSLTGEAGDGGDQPDPDPPESRNEVAGTFSAAAVAGMGFGSTAMDRIANATEETAKNTAKFAEPEVSE